jgi:hypothetical protein
MKTGEVVQLQAVNHTGAMAIPQVSAFVFRQKISG